MAQAQDAADEVRHIASLDDLPESTGNLGASIYSQAIDAGFRRVGDNREIPAAVYAAARVEGTAVRPRSLARHVGVDGDDVVSDMRRLIDTLPYDLSIEKPDAYVDDTLDALDAPDGLRDEAARILADATDESGYAPSGKTPSAFAGAVVYAAATVAGYDYTQSGVAEAAGVTPLAIRNQYRDVLDESGGRTGEPGDRDTMHDAVDRVVDAAGNVPDVVTSNAHDLVDRLPDETWVTRTDPKGVGAGAVYVVAKDNRVSIAQDAVADYAGVSKGTVVSRINDIRRWRGSQASFEARADAIRDSYKYNEMKRLAVENDVDVGPTPEAEALARALAEAGVEPRGEA